MIKDFATMTTELFGDNSEEVTRYFGNQFEYAIFRGKKEFLKRISDKLRKPLRLLDENSLGMFWFNRLIELQDKRDPNYILYVIRLFTPLSKYLKRDRRFMKKKERLEFLATIRLIEIKGINFDEAADYEDIQEQIGKLRRMGY